MNAVATEVAKEPIRLDLGCGKNKRAGFIGVDSRPFEGVDVVCDLVAKDVAKGANPLPDVVIFRKWQWEDSSVAEIHASHVVEHFTPQERIHFINEAYRVLIPDGKLSIIVPHYASERAYGDLTHQWPPVVGFWFYYLNKDWRAVNAPHNDQYTCHFEAAWGGSQHPSLAGRHPEYVQYATQWYREATQDMISELKAKK